VSRNAGLFVCAFLRECTETFQEGHKRAFDFLGGVAVRISYDNSKIAVITIGRGRNRKLTNAPTAKAFLGLLCACKVQVIVIEQVTFDIIKTLLSCKFVIITFFM
jgi:hypothetical protein